MNLDRSDLICDRCGGEGEITVRGYSHNPNCGFATPDPQEEREERCPDCHGTGEIDPEEGE